MGELKWLSRLGLALLWGVLFARPAEGQGADLEVQAEVEYAFGERIEFRVSFPHGEPIEGVEVFIQAGESSETVVGEAVLQEAAWVYEHDVRARSVRPFATVTYWFRAVLRDGSVRESQRFSFFYEDNRFDWQTLEGTPFRVHWYVGEADFAQLVLDTARFGAQEAGALLNEEFTERVEVYVYGQLADYQFTRDVMGPLWAGGHVDPEAGVIVVSLPPGEGQRLEVERKIPHEVAHLMLYQATGEGYWNLPAWLNEGFASMMERNPNPDYAVLLEDAVESGRLIPMSALCQPFPRDASGAVLAYAESVSFMRYVRERFGAEGLRALVDAYAAGAGCEYGTQTEPVGLTLRQLEREWREERLAENVALSALRELSPWLVLLGAMLVGPVVVLLSGRRAK